MGKRTVKDRGASPAPVARVRPAETVKDRVMLWLQARHHNQRWLAEQLGVSTAYIAMILSGARTPSLGVARRLEAITGIDATEFDHSRVA